MCPRGGAAAMEGEQALRIQAAARGLMEGLVHAPRGAIRAAAFAAIRAAAAEPAQYKDGRAEEDEEAVIASEVRERLETLAPVIEQQVRCMYLEGQGPRSGSGLVAPDLYVRATAAKHMFTMPIARITAAAARAAQRGTRRAGRGARGLWTTVAARGAQLGGGIGRGAANLRTAWLACGMWLSLLLANAISLAHAWLGGLLHKAKVTWHRWRACAVLLLVLSGGGGFRLAGSACGMLATSNPGRQSAPERLNEDVKKEGAPLVAKFLSDWDRDADGFLTADEFSAFLGEYFELHEDFAEQVFPEVDRNADGVLDKTELKKLLKVRYDPRRRSYLEPTLRFAGLVEEALAAAVLPVD